MRRRTWIPVLAGALTILASSIAPIVSSGARAADNQASVKAWIEINTTRPAVGCTTTFTIEIRNNGDAIANNSVSAALFSGSNPIDVARGNTNDGGVISLTVDTSSGAGDWVDLNVNGAFLTGFAIAAGKGSSCADSPRTVEISGSVPVDSAGGSSSTSGTAATSASDTTPAS